jgi:hypothetical protein
MGTSFFSRIFGKKVDLESIRAEIRRIERELRESFDADAFRNGDWFLQNFHRFAARYRDPDRIRRFEAAYPDLSEDQLADRLTSDAVRQSTLAGGATGVAVTAAELAGFLSWGMSLTVGAASAIAEMLYVTNLQIRLVFDLAAVNGITMSFDDTQEMLVIFLAALGFQDLDKICADESAHITLMTKAAIERQSVRLASSIGIRLIRSLVSRYAVPVLNIGFAAFHDWHLTSKVARASKARFSKLRVMKEQLFELQPSIGENVKDALLAPIVYFQSDGLITVEEVYILREFARSIHASDLWDRMMSGELTIESDEFIQRFRDPAHLEQRETLLRAIQVASQAKVRPNERESQFLQKLIAV